MLNSLKLGLVTVSTVAVLATAPLSFAQTATTSPTIKPINTLRCDKATTRIDALVIKGTARGQKIQETQDKVTSWWTNIGKDAFVKKYGQDNWTTLNGYFSTLNTTYGAPLTTDAKKYATDLSSLETMSKGGQCATSDGAFATQLKTVKADRDQLHTDIKNWRGYFNGTIRAFVQGLKSTTPTPTP